MLLLLFFYFQCSCCRLDSIESISDSLPDVCIAYKLHRECGKHINLYDWLQAFAAVVSPEEDDECRYQDITIQLVFILYYNQLCINVIIKF